MSACPVVAGYTSRGRSRSPLSAGNAAFIAQLQARYRYYFVLCRTQRPSISASTGRPFVDPVSIAARPPQLGSPQLPSQAPYPRRRMPARYLNQGTDRAAVWSMRICHSQEDLPCLKCQATRNLEDTPAGVRRTLNAPICLANGASRFPEQTSIREHRRRSELLPP